MAHMPINSDSGAKKPVNSTIALQLMAYRTAGSLIRARSPANISFLTRQASDENVR